MPKTISTDALINQVDDYAIQNHIEILDVSAKDPQKLEDYTSLGIHLAVKVKDFKDLVLFFYMIETSPYSLKVESLNGKIQDSKVGSITCDINIISNQIKL